MKPYGVKYNEKYFSFMSGDITPIFTVSVIGDRSIEELYARFYNT